MNKAQWLKDNIFDFEVFAEKHLQIKNEFGEIVPFRFNSAQRKVIARIKKKLGIKRITIENLKPKHVRLCFIYLKARQQGISTFWQAFLFWWNYCVPNQKGLTMGHELDASNNLFDMYKRYYDKLPKVLRPMIDKSNEKKISYKKTGSENKIVTAGKGDVGRSDTLQVVHATEVSRYPDAKTTFVGLLQGAKYAKIMVIESTADGFNEFHTEWVTAEAGESELEPVFLSWLEFPEYIEEAYATGQIKKFEDTVEEQKFIQSIGKLVEYNDYPGEENHLMDNHDATIDQIKWRRYMIINKCKKDINQFHQEYPTTPEEAFISSGSPVFDMNKVNENLNDSKEPLMIGDLVPIYDKSDEYEKKIASGECSYMDLKEFMTGVEFVESSRGFIKIWTKPEELEGSHRFCAGVDIAEGLAQGDYSVVRVLDRKSSEVHLTWHGHLDPDLLGDEIHKIWWYLGKECYFGIEKNYGDRALGKAFNLGVDLYFEEKFGSGEVRSSGKLGWQTNSKTKKALVENMVEWIREDLFQDYDEDFWKECRTFVRNPRGQMQADGKDKDPSVKNYDDRVMAGGIMLMVNNWLPGVIYKKEEEIVSRPYLLKPSGKPVGRSRF